MQQKLELSYLIGIIEKKVVMNARLTLSLMIFFAMCTAFMMRMNISVGIVAMTSNSTNPDFIILNWDTEIKTKILSSYFWGYMSLQLPAALYCQRYGPKYILCFAIFICGSLTLFTPLVAVSCDWKWVAAFRVLQGCCQSCIFSCIYSLVSKWIPPLERNRFFSFMFSGFQVGTVLTLLGSGYLSAGPGGWPSIFYITGSIAVLWAVLWAFIGANSPAEHNYISEHERNKIETSIVHMSRDNSKMKIPWIEIITSVPMWSVLLCHFCENWGFYTVLMLMPTYLSSAFEINIKNNGLLSSIPYMIMWGLNIIMGRLADYILKRELLHLTTARKMWTTIGMWGGALGFVGLTMTSSTTLAIVLLTLIMSLNTAVQYGYFTNHLDLGPNFASVLSGVTNTFANSASFISPLVAGYILKDEGNKKQWNAVFYICAIIFFVGNLIFMIFGTTDVQHWNDINEEDECGIPLTTRTAEKIVKVG